MNSTATRPNFQQRYQEAARRAADALGVDLANATVISESTARKILDGGVVVKLKIGRWQGMAQLTPEDLGIKLSDDPRKAKQQRLYLALGEKRLLPPEYGKRLKVIEVIARDLLKVLAVDDRTFGYFLSRKAWETFKKGIEDYRKRYFAIRDEITTKDEEIRAIVRAQYSELAHDAWRRVRRQGPDKLAPQEWVDNYVDRVMSKYPTREYIESSFYMDVAPTIIPLFQLISEEREASGVVTEITDDILLRREIAEYWADHSKEAIDDLLATAVNKVRGDLFAAVKNALKVGDDNEKVGTKTLKALMKTIELVKSVDIYGDVEVDVMMKGLKEKIAAEDEKQVDQEAVMNALTDLSTVLRASLLASGAVERGIVDIDDLRIDALDEADIREARTSLGLDMIETPEVVRVVYSNAMRTI